MREIVMDTETTGLDPNTGDRIVEIGAVELFNHMPTGKTYHQYINPQRDMPEGAFAVHGLSAEFLSDKPLFKDVAQAFLDFVGDSKMVIHNAAFDMKFINAGLNGSTGRNFRGRRRLILWRLREKNSPGRKTRWMLCVAGSGLKPNGNCTARCSIPRSLRRFIWN